jgi:hypothetical protein
MMETLATPESEGEPEGIEALLNRWCERSAQSPEELQQAMVKLGQIPQLDPDFRQALRGYLRAWFEDGDRDSYLQWFKGDPIKPKGVRIRIDRTNARTMLRSLIQFLKHLGYSGLVLFLDELELIREEQNRRVRDASYDVLRQFIDDADNLQNFLLLCSATPIMCDDDQKGFPSYDALWQRLGGLLGGVKGDYRANMVNLDEAPLSDDELLELAKRLRTIYTRAWDVEEQIVPDEFLRRLVQVMKQQAPEMPFPRLVVQTTVSLLEAKQQNPEKDLEDLLPGIIQDAMKRIRQQERDRYHSQKRDPYRPWE